MSAYDDWLAAEGQRRTAGGLTRRLNPREAEGRAIDLASNDYLGLARDARVVAAASEAVATWGAGSTGSRLVTGSTTLHRDLEVSLARFTRSEAALAFSSGYTANLGVLTALGGPDTLIVSDADNHASIIDACRLSRSTVAVTGHRDVTAVANAIAARREARAIVVVDAVFSADGNTADASALYDVCRRHDALLVIDEAHSVGVIGADGRGVAAAAGIDDRPDVVRTVTLSKALGSQGGAVVGSRAIIDQLVNAARTFIFDTALAPASAAAALAALNILEADPALVGALHARRDEVARGMDANAPDGAVISVILGEPGLTLRVAEACRESGILVGCFRPPAVPAEGSRLRVTARANLTDVEIKTATGVVAELIERLR